MKLIDKYQVILHNGIYIIQAIAYTVSFFIISVSIIKSAFIYVKDYNDRFITFNNIKLELGESSSLALSFILGVEILKLFYIKNYKQLIIVICLVAIKLTVSYFLESEIKQIDKKNT